MLKPTLITRYYSPEEPTGGTLGTADSALAAGWDTVPEIDDESALSDRPSGTEEPAAEPVVPAAEPVTEEAGKVEPTTEDPPAADAEPVAEVAATAEETPAESAPVADATKAALLAAAEALGIAETDPDKIPAAIEAHRAKANEDRESQRAAIEQEIEQKADADFRKQASEVVSTLIDPVVMSAVIDKMRAEGYPVDTPDFWKAETWENPKYGPELEGIYKERFASTKAEMAKDERYENVYQAEYGKLKSAFDAEKSQVASITDKYPHVAPDAVSGLRRAGLSAKHIETIASLAHQAADRAIATQNSALAAKDAELTTLRAQVSGISEAVAKAKADGILEGRNAALETVKSGQALAASVGTGLPVAGPTGLLPADYDEGINGIPWATQN